MAKENRDVVGFCTYCKEEIYDGDITVIVNDNDYHMKCYNLIKEELEGEE